MFMHILYEIYTFVQSSFISSYINPLSFFEKQNKYTHHHHQCVLPFTANAGTKFEFCPKTGPPLQTQEPKLQFY